MPQAALNKKQPRAFAITSVNVRSLSNNWNVFANSGAIKSNVICIQEIWQIPNINQVNLKGFNKLEFITRKHNRGGGVGIYVKKGITYETFDTPFIEKELESIGIKVIIGEMTLFILSVYRNPNSANGIDILDNWLKIQNSNIKDNLVIIGDLNVNTLKNTSLTRRLTNFRVTNGLKSHIKGITRIQSRTSIDHALTSKSIKYTWKASILDEEVADHYILNLSTEIECRQTKSKILSYNKINEETLINLRRKLNLVNWSSLEGKDNNSATQELIETIKTHYENECPLVTRKLNRKNDFIEKWMTKDLLDKKVKLKKLSIKLKTNDKIMLARYNLEKRIYKNAINRTKKDYLFQKLKQAGGNSKETWKILNNNCGLQSGLDEINTIKSQTGNLLFNNIEISNEFSKYYKDAATDLASLLNVNTEEHKEYLPDRKDEWEFIVVTKEEVMKTIQSLKNKRSSGFDGISNRLIKNIGDIIAKPISKLINQSITEANFPKILKEAKVVPIHKKGSKLEVANYRPISLLPALSKIWEKIINTQLTERMNDLEVISDTQFGFRKNHNTTNAVQRLVQEVNEAKRNNKVCAAVFIDITKAFDCCRHDIILNKLNNIGLNQKGVKFMESYLKGRYQAVKIGESTSDKVEIGIGVGQGTILGPTLFKLYLYDFQNCINSITLLFADDTSLLVKADTLELLQEKTNEELHKIHKWFKSNGLTLHPGKTRAILFGRGTLNINVDGQQIVTCGNNQEEKFVNMLGIYIDQKLNWAEMIDKVNKQITKTRFILRKFKHSLTQKSKKLIYYAFVDSHLRYGISLWGGTKGRAMSKLITKHKTLIRSIEIGRFHTEPILKKNEILNIRDLYKLEMSKLAWQYRSKTLPRALSSKIEVRNIARELRDTSKVIIPRSRCEKDMRQFDISLCKFINTLDTRLENVKSRKTLSEKIKKELLNRYRSDVTCNSPVCCECSLLN